MSARLRSSVIAAAATLACASCSSLTQVRGDGFVLTSPFGRESTEAWRTLVGDELAAVSRLFPAVPPSPPVAVFLDPVEVGDDADIGRQLNPDVGGIHAWAFGGSEVHVLVNPRSDGMFATSAHEHLRHEFSHVCLHRLGVAVASWFDEGLAEELEDSVLTASGLQLHPSPIEISLARALAPGVDMREVWTWDGRRTAEPEREAVIRTLARSFVRFLLEREGGDWRTQLRQLVTLIPPQYPTLETEWRQWLDEFDITQRIDMGTRSDDALRVAAARSLPTLADAALRMAQSVPSLGTLLDARMDALAVRLVLEGTETSSAGSYLAFFRFRALPEASIRQLTEAASPPAARLVGHALEARLGKPVEAESVRALWLGLSRAERIDLIWLPATLPLEP